MKVNQEQSAANIILTASILAADPLNIESALKRCQQTDMVDWVQVDVMDGYFTPNLSFGPSIVRSMKAKFDFFVDVHLMVHRPKRLLEAFALNGADLITVHLEARDSARECLKIIRSLGKKTGLAIKPTTPLKRALPLLPFVDLLLVMTVNPGFAGQRFIPECVKKIKQARDLMKNKYDNIEWLEVDGGINVETIPDAVRAGANVVVCGSSLFGKDPLESVPQLRNAIGLALNHHE